LKTSGKWPSIEDVQKQSAWRERQSKLSTKINTKSMSRVNADRGIASVPYGLGKLAMKKMRNPLEGSKDGSPE
jgi:hypothetical protein